MEVLISTLKYVIAKDLDKYHVYFLLKGGDLFWKAHFCSYEEAEKFAKKTISNDLYHIKNAKVIKKEKNPILDTSFVYAVHRESLANNIRDLICIVDSKEKAEKYIKYLESTTSDSFEKTIKFACVKVPYAKVTTPRAEARSF